jgi:hypothetical protein
MKLVRLAIVALGAAVWPGACVEHTPDVERTGGPRPEFDAACLLGSCADRPVNAVSWCEARAVIHRKCTRCHGDPPDNGAPFPLVSFDDTQRCHNDRPVSERMHVAVESGAMPFVELTEILSLSPPVEDLTPEEKTVLLTWLEQGACPVGGIDCDSSDAASDTSGGDAAAEGGADAAGADADAGVSEASTD